MDDKTFLDHEFAESCISRRERMTTEEWLAPLDREIEKLEEILEENARIFGLPPLNQPVSASSSRR
jgi:hypothetical protein